MARSFISGFAACLLLFAMHLPSARAAEAMDAELAQTVQAINGELAAFCIANRTPPAEAANAPQLTPRAPRHVAAKARDLLVRLQVLRRLNGLEEQVVEELPVKDLTAQDAKAVADKLLAATRDLRPAFGNPPPVTPVAAGTSATDAYAVLVQAEARLEALDIPALVPNDVYRGALRLMSDLDRLRAARKLPAVPVEAAEPGLGPADAYDAALALMDELKRLADEHPAFQGAGGLALAERQGGGIRPETVMSLLGHLGAEVGVLKVRAGITQPTKKIAPQAGKTPGDTVAVLRAARQVVIALRAS